MISPTNCDSLSKSTDPAMQMCCYELRAGESRWVLEVENERGGKGWGFTSLPDSLVKSFTIYRFCISLYSSHKANKDLAA